MEIFILFNSNYICQLKMMMTNALEKQFGSNIFNVQCLQKQIIFECDF